MSQCIAGKCRLQMFPVHQILAHRMSPVHVAPHRAVRIILIEQVILTIFIYQSVGIVHPSVERSMVIQGTVLVCIGRVKSIRKLEFFPTQSLLRQVTDTHGYLFLSLRQSKGNKIVHFLP